jgi:hypothetical protein
MHSLTLNSIRRLPMQQEQLDNAQKVLSNQQATTVLLTTGEGKQVSVCGAHHVSRKLLGVLSHVLATFRSGDVQLEGDKQNSSDDTPVPWGLDTISFRTDLDSKFDDFARFNADHRIITVNLSGISDFTIEQVKLDTMETKHGVMSLNGMFWWLCLDSLLHELFHAWSVNVDREAVEANVRVNENQASEYATDALIKLAKETDIDQPALADEPWFGFMAWSELLKCVHSGEEWAAVQQRLIDANLVWGKEGASSNMDERMSSFREYVRTQMTEIEEPWNAEVTEIELIENGTGLKMSEIMPDTDVNEDAAAAVKEPEMSSAAADATMPDDIETEDLDLMGMPEPDGAAEGTITDLSGEAIPTDAEEEPTDEAISTVAAGDPPSDTKAADFDITDVAEFTQEQVIADLNATLAKQEAELAKLKQEAAVVQIDITPEQIVTDLNAMPGVTAKMEPAYIPTDEVIDGDAEPAATAVVDPPPATPPVTLAPDSVPPNAYISPDGEAFDLDDAMSIPDDDREYSDMGGEPEMPGAATTSAPAGPALAAEPATLDPQAAANLTPSSNIQVEDPGLTAEQYEQVILGIYDLLCHNIYKVCGWQKVADPGAANSPVDFCTLTKAEAVVQPISVNEILAQVPGSEKILLTMDTLNAEHRWAPDTPIQNGMIKGQVFKTSGLPGYTLTFNVSGTKIKRTIVPQNPNKKYDDGNLKGTAISARQGSAVCWIMDGMRGVSKFYFKWNNGTLESL